MDWFVDRFIRASLVWLAIGVGIGVLMAFLPGRAIVFRPAHAHANLAGFVSMFIYGVAYHVIPRFVGRPLYSRRLAGWHFWISNAGLALLVSGWVALGFGAVAGKLLLRAGAIGFAAGAVLFILNIWRSLGPDRREARLTTLTKA